MSEKEFINLIEKNQGIIHKICRLYTDTHTDYDDLFQEIMLQLWQSISSYQGKAKISTYMYRVALFTALNKVKYDKKQKLDPEEIKHQLSEETDQRPESILHLATQLLDPSDKALVSLYLDEKNYKEMADILGLSESNVGVRLNRIKKKLRTILKAQDYGA